MSSNRELDKVQVYTQWNPMFERMFKDVGG